MPVRPSLADPRFHHALAAMVRKRVPEGDADDIVQSALADALASSSAPEEPEAVRKWVFGVAKHKIADYYRKRRREQPTEAIEVAADEMPYSERDLLRWAERELPPNSDSPKTLEWMLREGEGEKLESIAESEQLPAPRVRQRVSRMRRFLKERWLASAALAGLLLAALLAYRYRPRPEPIVLTPDVPSAHPSAAPTADPRLELARKDRADALEACGRKQWRDCLDGLDRAAVNDPAGDADPSVSQARAAASSALTPPPPPSAVPVPTSTAKPLSTSAPTTLQKSGKPSSTIPDSKWSDPDSTADAMQRQMLKSFDRSDTSDTPSAK